ncbi:MAG TPA: hypothetical protein DCL77_03790 [Prolixibacteraceae bacterium]|jgi:hypothetical protein|nr:hypothetical protein [Prolixibacteraceae bacterium]
MIVNEGEGYRSFDVSNIFFHHNVLENVGMTDLSNYPIWIEGYGSNKNITLDNFYIYNNSIQSTGSSQALTAIQWHVAGEFSNIFIQNNIIGNCRNSPVTFESNLSGATLANVTVSNNLYYDNNSNAADFNMKPNHKTESNNIVGNPKFVSSSDYHLRTGSPAINKGKNSGRNISLPYYGSAPDIGAFETRFLDITLPIVSAFNIPSTSNSLSVPISISAATDKSEVTGYLLTETPESPSSGEAGWISSFPAQYVFLSEGRKTLYAWVKDASGNVSAPLTGSVSISLNKSAEIPMPSDEKILSTNDEQSSVKSESLASRTQEPIKIDVFPNPCKDNVNVSFSVTPEPGSRIEIRDITGRKVASREITNENERFYFGEQAPGLYIVKTIVGSNEVNNKLIISR